MKDINATILVTSGLLVGSFFSYLLQFFLGRSLSVSDYGAFNALLSVAVIVGVPATVFGIPLVKEVASLSAKKEEAKLSALFWQAMLWSVAAGLIVFGFFYIFRDSVLSSLKITNIKLVTSFAFYLSLNFLWSVPYAYLQGLLQYKLFTFFVVASSFLRFAFPMLFLLADKNLSNVFLAMAFATCITVLLALLFLKRDFVHTKDLAVWKELLFIIKFSFPVIITNLCLMAFNNNDLILVRRYFSPEDSGYYAGTVTLGKIMLFGASSVVTVMFPKISGLKSKNENIKPMFWLFLKIQLALVAIGLFIFAVFPKLIALAFFGTKFLESVKYLPLFAVFVGLYVLLNFLILFLFAVDITSLFYILFILVMTQALLITNFHANIFQVITVNISVISVALSAALFYSFRFLNKQTS